MGDYNNQEIEGKRSNRRKGTTSHSELKQHPEGMRETPSNGIIGTAYGGESRTQFDNQSQMSELNKNSPTPPLPLNGK